MALRALCTWPLCTGLMQRRSKLACTLYLAIVCRADAEAVKVGLALAETVLEAACGGKGGALLPLQAVFTLRFCLLTPPVGLQCVGCLPPSANGAHTSSLQSVSRQDAMSSVRASRNPRLLA